MLRTYEAFLIKKGTIKSQYVPFYLKWAFDCYSSLNEPLSNRLRDEQKKQFLSQIAKRYEDWQVKQADWRRRTSSVSAAPLTNPCESGSRGLLFLKRFLLNAPRPEGAPACAKASAGRLET